VSRAGKVPDKYGAVAMRLSENSVYLFVEINFHFKLKLATEFTEFLWRIEPGNSIVGN
jgi:hypothetical protein